jgi:hypothetical protein
MDFESVDGMTKHIQNKIKQMQLELKTVFETDRKITLRIKFKML